MKKYYFFIKYSLLLFSVCILLFSCQESQGIQNSINIEAINVYFDNKDGNENNDNLDFNNPIFLNVPITPEIVITFSVSVDIDMIDRSKISINSSSGDAVLDDDLMYEIDSVTGSLKISFKSGAPELTRGSTYRVFFSKDTFGSDYSFKGLSFSFATVLNETSKDILSFDLKEIDNSRYIRGDAVGEIDLRNLKIEIPYFPAIPPESQQSALGGVETRDQRIILKPSITISGIRISPRSEELYEFAELVETEPGDERYDPSTVTYRYDYKTIRYTVTASDGSEKIFNVKLREISKESPISVPRNIDLTNVNNSTADIVWLPPESTGVNPDNNQKAKISYYLVTYRKSGEEKVATRSVAEPKISLQNLDFDSNYIMQITAFNEPGDSSNTVTFIFKTTL